MLTSAHLLSPLLFKEYVLFNDDDDYFDLMEFMVLDICISFKNYSGKILALLLTSLSCNLLSKNAFSYCHFFAIYILAVYSKFLKCLNTPRYRNDYTEYHLKRIIPLATFI
jgi:hypothetical protein